MLTMAVGQSDDVEPAVAIAEAIAQCREQLASRAPRGAMLFVAFDSFDPSIVRAVRDAFPGIALMGSTSAAEMSSTVGYREDSIALAVFAAEDVDVTVGLGTGLDLDVDAACRAAVADALAATTRAPRVCIMLAADIATNAQRAVEGMTAALPPGVLLVGGVASRSDMRVRDATHQFVNDRVVQDGVAILILSGEIAVSWSVGTGWRTLGQPGVVTRSENGVIHEIDGQPAADYLTRYLDVSGPASWGNPLAVLEGGAQHHYLRVVVGVDEATGALLVPGTVPAGSQVQVTTATTDEIVAATENAVRQATDAFPAGAHPTAALVFSCAVRKYLLGSRTKQEIDLARLALPPLLPLAGMYAEGEIAPVGGGLGSRLINESFVTVLLGG